MRLEKFVAPALTLFMGICPGCTEEQKSEKQTYSDVRIRAIISTEEQKGVKQTYSDVAPEANAGIEVDYNDLDKKNQEGDRTNDQLKASQEAVETEDKPKYIEIYSGLKPQHIAAGYDIEEHLKTMGIKKYKILVDEPNKKIVDLNPSETDATDWTYFSRLDIYMESGRPVKEVCASDTNGDKRTDTKETYVYRYDESGRMVEKNEYLEVDVHGDWNFTSQLACNTRYDSDGRDIGGHIINRNGKHGWSYEYDGEGRVTKLYEEFDWDVDGVAERKNITTYRYEDEKKIEEDDWGADGIIDKTETVDVSGE